jgi:hypothetical protein
MIAMSGHAASYGGGGKWLPRRWSARRHGRLHRHDSRYARLISHDARIHRLQLRLW